VTDETTRLRHRLKEVGLTDTVISAAWPVWWSDDAEASESARTELRFSLARKLGLDPRSLLNDNDQPRFVWRDEARFKHLASEGELELAAITSFGKTVASLLINATRLSAHVQVPGAVELRSAILGTQPFVRLLDLISLCWSLGIPVVHPRVFPCARKRMAAMSVRVRERDAILLGKDSVYPAHIAFYLAHEFGHIALGHLATEAVLIDLEYTELTFKGDDREEIDADRFALELLTGRARPSVLPKSGAYNAQELARTALSASIDLRIEPGTLALCFGYSTGDWATANAAMKHIYSSPNPAWNEVNGIALEQLQFDRVPDDSLTFLRAILDTADRRPSE
jgi:hypothetical protein